MQQCVGCRWKQLYLHNTWKFCLNWGIKNWEINVWRVKWKWISSIIVEEIYIFLRLMSLTQARQEAVCAVSGRLICAAALWCNGHQHGGRRRQVASEDQSSRLQACYKNSVRVAPDIKFSFLVTLVLIPTWQYCVCISTCSVIVDYDYWAMNRINVFI